MSVFIVGPTATGKTELAISLAKRLNGEIISADSMQIYSELFIGTARPSKEEMQGIPHHIMGCISPAEPYSAACFQRDARLAEADIISRDMLPIIVGGTGLYVHALTHDIDFTKTPADNAIREKYVALYDEHGGEYLLSLIEKKDPAAAARLHKNDKLRLVRRLEILESEGANEEYSFIKPIEGSIIIGLNMDRAVLYERINKRVQNMFDAGLAAEARQIYDKYGAAITAFSAIGYKEFIPYFNEEATLGETLEAIARNTRRFAKRQLTWFKRDKRIKWFMRDCYASNEELFLSVYDYIATNLKETGSII